MSNIQYTIASPATRSPSRTPPPDVPINTDTISEQGEQSAPKRRQQYLAANAAADAITAAFQDIYIHKAATDPMPESKEHPTSGPADPAPAPLSQAEFAEQFSRCYRLLWLVATGIVHDRTRGEDVVQDAALLALGKLDQFKRGTSFSAWMSQIVRFTAMNERRKYQRRRGPSTDAHPRIGPAADPATVTRVLKLTSAGRLPADQSDFDDRLTRALDSISDIARTCLLLRTIEDLDYKQIAQLLDIPAGTAMSHVHRARHALRRQLETDQPSTPPRDAPQP
ncbi:MAG: hypothetical protein CMJ49_03750 [Planctomycetaceae bacterium]|nr:hypothetical protein [Planctomycetaceae bacterium]